MSKNNDPFAPWNNPMNDSPFKPWNELFGREEDLTDEEANYYGVRRNKYDGEADYYDGPEYDESW